MCRALQHGKAHAGETVFTENVSSHGARVKTKRAWQPGERVLIRSLEGGLESVAQIVYGEPSRENYAIGFKLLNPAAKW